MSTTQKSEQPGAVQLFTHPSFGTIRTAGDADHPLFCLTDVCKVLGLTAKGVKQRLEDGVISNYLILDKFGRRQHVNFVNEDGLYDAIFDSRKACARAFRKWVTKEVLPSIRKTGHYGVAPANPAPVSLEDFKQSLVNSMQELVIETVNDALKSRLPMPAEGKPSKAPREYYLYEVANELGTSAETLKRLLKSIHLLTEKKGYLFGETGYFGQFTPCMWNHPEFVIVNENGRREILSAYQTFKKQNPKLK